MALPLGVYTISNVRFPNYTHLPSGNDREYLVGIIASDVAETEQWTLEPGEGDRYRILNVKFGTYARVTHSPKAGDEVYTTEAKFWWKIQMQSQGKYLMKAMVLL
ncbi:hypothetical protein B0H14DRAFT_3903549 [Mycena olivaceomarginata]|nr:hypothetical protein B0H14DRAFT_3903549 [Mycena olivaceomarginata]